MNRSVERIVIVGGGTAGWLSACYLAARLSERTPEVQITLVESPDIATIGVGEGTWPTMRETLATIGIDETEFLVECDGSFKQGSRFDGWVTGERDDSYLHPFTAPPVADIGALLSAWATLPEEVSFASAMTPQASVCANDLAPRQAAMPPYAGALNYAYHLDAAKFAGLLSRHATARLGVRHLTDTVVGVRQDGEGGIAAISTRDNGAIKGDLFIDCSGLAAVLIGDAMKVDWIDLSAELLNDRALAVQLPVEQGSPVASQTVATAHPGGWLWDIALPTRRGIGCVYSSRFMSDDEAENELRAYIARTGLAADPQTIAPRLLRFPSGHRSEFWKGNCLAIGLSAGFIEPLEASAIVLIELSLRALADNFPRSRRAMPIYAERFNRLFALRWRRIADFLKLHYTLSQRDEPYWHAQRDAATVSPQLAALLELWKDQPPSTYDFPLSEEIFPAASHQYVYYGMTGRAEASEGSDAAISHLAQVRDRSRQLGSALPSNRAYLDRLRGGGPAVMAQGAV
jgi:tryptophan halogenase